MDSFGVKDLFARAQDRSMLERHRLTLERDRLMLERDRLTRAERAICGGGSLKNLLKQGVFRRGLVKICPHDQQVKDGFRDYLKKFHKNH